MVGAGGGGPGGAGLTRVQATQPREARPRGWRPPRQLEVCEQGAILAGPQAPGGPRPGGRGRAPPPFQTLGQSSPFLCPNFSTSPRPRAASRQPFPAAAGSTLLKCEPN